MDKVKILRDAKAELRNHQWDYFCTEAKSVAEGGSGVVVSGCPTCKARFGTTAQYLDHLANDVLPVILRKAFATASG